MRRLLLMAGLILFAGLLVWLLRPKAPRSDEELIRDSIDRMAAATQKKDVSAIAEEVSERYHGEGGDKRELKTYLLAFLMRGEFVRAIPARVQISLTSESAAEVSLVVVLARGDVKGEQDLRPELVVGTHKMDAHFAKEGDQWRVIDARGRDAAARDLFP